TLGPPLNPRHRPDHRSRRPHAPLRRQDRAPGCPRLRDRASTPACQDSRRGGVARRLPAAWPRGARHRPSHRAQPQVRRPPARALWYQADGGRPVRPRGADRDGRAATRRDNRADRRAGGGGVSIMANRSQNVVRKATKSTPPVRTVQTPENAEAFLAALSEGASVYKAGKAAGIGRANAYFWRQADEDFKRRWDLAVDDGNDSTEDEDHRRGVHGVDKPV